MPRQKSKPKPLQVEGKSTIKKTKLGDALELNDQPPHQNAPGKEIETVAFSKLVW